MKTLSLATAALLVAGCAPLFGALSSLGPPPGPYMDPSQVQERCFDAETERMTAEACR